ncbi:MAG: hypothetical protein WKF73_03435 [Nocardioidaceae bacterium]
MSLVVGAVLAEAAAERSGQRALCDPRVRAAGYTHPVSLHSSNRRSRTPEQGCPS